MSGRTTVWLAGPAVRRSDSKFAPPPARLDAHHLVREPSLGVLANRAELRLHLREANLTPRSAAHAPRRGRGGRHRQAPQLEGKSRSCHSRNTSVAEHRDRAQ